MLLGGMVRFTFDQIDEIPVRGQLPVIIWQIVCVSYGNTLNCRYRLNKQRMLIILVYLLFAKKTIIKELEGVG